MAEFGFTIGVALPGQNKFIDANRKHWTQGNKMKKEAEDQIKAFIEENCWINSMEAETFQKPVYITFRWYEQKPTGRAIRDRDPDNLVFAKKFILDALQSKKIIANDRRKQIAAFRDIFVYDQERPMVEVYLTDEIPSWRLYD